MARRRSQLRRAVSVLRLVCRDPRVPRHVKLLAGGLLVYAVSPIDLIPDFIPVVGHLDDVVLIPLGLYLIGRMIPGEVLEDCGEGRPAGSQSGGPRRQVCPDEVDRPVTGAAEAKER